ncbi:hypothetical protein VNO77_40841 [Canavalia gladiata]|uniref:Uncharacterized protein n=1 Tax=Canavalia gladiata TaxID=3824 RepID=A0AAN9K095_CANGL
MYKYFAIFLAIVATCHGSLFAHARKIKPLDQQPSQNTNSVEVINVPTPSPNQFKVDTSNMPKHDFAEVDSGEYYSDAHYTTNAFRPTTPGNSPGVGHRKIVDVKVMGVLVQSPGVQVSVAQGVGHPHENKN